MANIKDNLQIGLGCLAMPFMICGFAIFVTSLPLCIIIGLVECVLFELLAYILKFVGVDLEDERNLKISISIGLILMIIIVAIIYFSYPNIFFSLMMFGDDYFPRLKP